MQQMCSRVIAHCRLPDIGIDDSVHPVTHANCLLGDDLMGTHSLDRRIASLHFGYDGVVIIAVEPSSVAYLSAGFGIKRRVIKDHFAFFARLEFVRALALADDG